MKQEQFLRTLALAVSIALISVATLTGCSTSDRESTEGTENASSVSENSDDSADDTSWASENSELPSEKNEVVTVKAEPDGTPREMTSAVTLKLPEAASQTVLQDFTNLSKIKNSEGDEEFLLAEDGTLLWQNHEEDVSYEGSYLPDGDSTDGSRLNAALPVNVKVTYYLDGQEKSYAEMKGCSGKVTIRFDYTNLTEQYVDVDGSSEKAIIPFAVVSMALMDEDIFSDIEVENGEVSEMEGSQIAVGMAFPGLDEYLNLSSYEGMEDIDPIPDYVEITANAENFELEFTETIVSNGLLKELDEDSFDDIDDLMDAMEDLEDASGEILDGIGELADGADEFQDYLDQYMDGVDSLADGAKSLAAGVKTLNSNKTALADGADALADGLKQLNSSLGGSGDESLSQVTSAMSALVTDLKSLGSDLEDWADTLSAMENYVKEAEAWKETASESIKNADDVLAKIDTDALAEEDADAAQAIKDARGYLAKALKEEFPSTPKMNLDSKDIAELTADIQKQMGIIASSAQLLSSFGESISQMQTAVSSLAEGSSQLAAGIKSFNEGIGQLSGGAEQLSEGCSTLSTSGHKIAKGFSALTDGISELKKGYKEFDEEGIQELADLADGDLKDLIKKVKALRIADKSYDTFSGKPEGVESSVLFMIETSEEE